MKVICRIYRGQLFSERELRLEDLAPFATHFYQHRPRMIKYRNANVTLLIFTSLRFRLMGSGESHWQVLNDFLHSLPCGEELKVKKEDLVLSGMTVTHQLSRKNINLRSLNEDFRVELELFPAAQWLHGRGKEHINVFHTGSVVITGVTSIDKAEQLIAQLEQML